MADKIQNVRIRYTTEGIPQAKSQVSGLNEEEKKAVDTFNKLNKSAKSANETIQKETKQSSNELNNFGKTGTKVAGAIAAVFAIDQIISFGKQVVSITAEFQKFEAVLTNTLGSKSAAYGAFNQIQTFASQTPYSVAQLTESFVKLANQGFQPTTNELRKLGDLASSTGKGFDQLSEAIIDAQTGEFERLKEFGIRASKEGDKVSFTFKGVKQQVDFTNDSIRNYILSLGDAEGVTGSMAAISETLGGQISNLGDSWDALLTTIGSGTGSVFTGAIAVVKDFVDGLQQLLETQDQINKRVTGEGFNLAYEEALGTLKKLNTEAANEALSNQLDKLNIRLQDINVNLRKSEQALEGSLTGSWFNNLEEDIAHFKGLQQEIQGEIDGITKAIADNAEAIKKKSEADKKAEEDASKARQKKSDELFKIRMNELNQLEGLAVRRAEVEDKSESDVIDVKIVYNEKKLQLIRDFGKQAEFIYKDLGLREVELEKQKNDLKLKASIDFAKEYGEGLKKLDDDRLKQSREFAQKYGDGLREQRNESLEESAKFAKEYGEGLRKQDEETRKAVQAGIISTFSDVVNALSQMRQEAFQKEINTLNEARQEELGKFADSKAAQAALNEKYDKQERNIKRQAAISERNNALFNIALSTAQAIGKANPVVPLMVLAGATGAAQSAIVLSKPIPYNKGTKKVPGVGNKDTVSAVLTPGEAVITADKNKEYSPAISAIFDGKVPANAMNNFVLDYQRLSSTKGGSSFNGSMNELKEINKTLKGLKNTSVNLDKNGFTSYVQSSSSKTTITNNYYRN